jgi:hypothetical protein
VLEWFDSNASTVLENSMEAIGLKVETHLIQISKYGIRACSKMTTASK